MADNTEKPKSSKHEMMARLNVSKKQKGKIMKKDEARNTPAQDNREKEGGAANQAKVLTVTEATENIVPAPENEKKKPDPVNDLSDVATEVLPEAKSEPTQEETEPTEANTPKTYKRGSKRQKKNSENEVSHTTLSVPKEYQRKVRIYSSFMDGENNQTFVCNAIDDYIKKLVKAGKVPDLKV